MAIFAVQPPFLLSDPGFKSKVDITSKTHIIIVMLTLFLEEI